MVEVAIAIVAAVIGVGTGGVGIAWLNDRRNAAKRRRNPPDDPRRLLDARFASGEIDATEYARSVHLLTYGPPLELEQPG